MARMSKEELDKLLADSAAEISEGGGPAEGSQPPGGEGPDRVVASLDIKPLSVNSAYRDRYDENGNPAPGRASTRGHKEYCEAVAAAVQAQVPRDLPTSRPVSVRIQYWMAGARVRRLPDCDGLPDQDVGNYDKPLLDALEGVLWEDDVQIVELSLAKRAAEEDKVVVVMETVEG